jgi:hypothetical protein
LTKASKPRASAPDLASALLRSECVPAGKKAAPWVGDAVGNLEDRDRLRSTDSDRVASFGPEARRFGRVHVIGYSVSRVCRSTTPYSTSGGISRSGFGAGLQWPQPPIGVAYRYEDRAQPDKG